MEEVIIKTAQLVEEIKNMETINDIRPNLLELPMIDDICKYMYRKVSKGKPISTIVNGVRIIMYEV